MERLTIPDTPIEGGLRRSVIDVREVRKYAMTIYWQLKKYEDVGLTPDQIRQVDELYREKCEEVNRLRAELAAERQKHRWIPVEKGKEPPADGGYLCTLNGELCGQEEPFTGMCWIENGVWDEPGMVIAYQEMPEPYQPEKGGAIHET